MNMNARNQYLKVLQEKYFMTRSRKDKSSILDEYCGNTSQNRKYVIRKLSSPISLVIRRRGGKPVIYDGQVKAVLAKTWEIFDYPCGQRLAPVLRTEVDRLRVQEELVIPNEIADKLKRISPRTIDRALRRQKEALHLNQKYRQKRNPPNLPEDPGQSRRLGSSSARAAPGGFSGTLWPVSFGALREYRKCSGDCFWLVGRRGSNGKRTGGEF